MIVALLKGFDYLVGKELSSFHSLDGLGVSSAYGSFIFVLKLPMGIKNATVPLEKVAKKLLVYLPQSQTVLFGGMTNKKHCFEKQCECISEKCLVYKTVALTS